jgi:hypothetical protein
MIAQDIINKRKELWERNLSIVQDNQFTEAVANHILEDAELRKQIQEHPEYLIEMVFVIVDKNKSTVPFFLNDVQHDFINKVNEAIQEFKEGTRLHLKFLILKGRQQGFTSLITAYQLACTITKKNFEGFTAADEDGNSSAIFENKAKLPYNRLPEAIKPTEKYNNKKQLIFEKLHSSWEVKTATKNMGRSRTINFFHGSEAAFWKIQISDVQAGLGDSLTKDAIQILESTADGYNEYKDLWDSGKWENCFYEWWRTNEYRHGFESETKEQWFKDKLENGTEWIWERCRWLKEFLEWNQVYWYYVKWNGYIDGELIKQEYPCSPEEAFLASGRCVFNQETIVHHINNLRKRYEDAKPLRGYFSFEWNNPDTQDKIKDDTIKWVDHPQGDVMIYENKMDRYPYVIGGDTKGEGKDFYTGTVINNITGKRSATLRMEISNSKPYTWQMYCLGKHFNYALIGIEMNFNTAPIEELERLKYHRQYVRKKYDSFNKEILDKFGWRTDGNTRPLIIDKEVDLIENNIDLFTDIIMLGECLTFVYDEKNRPDAESGKHDDLLFSDMIANEIRSQQTMSLQAEAIEKVELPFALRTEKKSTGGFMEW